MSTNSTAVYLSAPDDLSIETTTTIVTVNIVALVGVISIFGIACNIINILVFCKQGFSETTNISYTALAISDLLSLINSWCLSVFWNPWFLNSGLPVVFFDIQTVFATWPYACFSRINGLVTAFVTFERCLCVVWPLQVKRILTSTVTIIVLISIYFIMCLVMVPVYSISTLGWRSEPWTNMTLLGVIMGENAELISNISYTVQSATQLFAFFTVSVCTATLIACLKQNTKWRAKQSTTQNAIKKVIKRQSKAIKMVTLIAATYVISQLPTIISLAVTVLYSDFGPVGRYKNLFLAFWTFLLVCGVLNSTVNLVVYYVMSSKFRQSCNQILSKLLINN
ncbi:unnamed protein product [Candidula unifasciata]|uniref:G-protein coupled receptors family 1 profile domain-containing protein n=1 Tax=Candidula unifasciata TaxID=100452 RepID=A0A8S3YMA2_9EUPU|nr:unnamed protein product [Candidula unifasciata]